MTLGLTSISGSSVKNEVATASRASSDQALNQSIVQHVTSEGNRLSRALNVSPLGLNKINTFKKEKNETENIDKTKPQNKKQPKPRLN